MIQRLQYYYIITIFIIHFSNFIFSLHSLSKRRRGRGRSSRPLAGAPHWAKSEDAGVPHVYRAKSKGLLNSASSEWCRRCGKFVDLDEGCERNISLQEPASIQPTTTPVKFACVPRSEAHILLWSLSQRRWPAPPRNSPIVLWEIATTLSSWYDAGTRKILC